MQRFYYYGYNHSTFARRVHDVLTTVSFAQHNENYDVQKISLVGSDGAGRWAAAARAIAGGEVIQKAWIDTGDFRFQNLKTHWGADFLPGAVKYGDIDGLLVLNAPYDTAGIDTSDSVKNVSRKLGGKFNEEEDLAAYFFK